MATKLSANAPEDISDETPARALDLEKIERGIRLVLEGVGEDMERPGLQLTPRRVAQMYAEMTAGMREDANRHIIALPGDKHDEMVIVRDIHFASLCEHHLAPFMGRCHIAYIPKGGRIVGLSKLARLVEAFARRLQVQERLTSEIADTLYDGLEAPRRDGRDGSRAHLHVSARRQEARRAHHHLGHPRRLPQRLAHPRRGDGAHPRKGMKAVTGKP